MEPLIILTGPTAVGKTELSVRLAKETGGEIISADSMQVYKHMDIGSAKISPAEMDGVWHHLIDVLDPRDDFNVVLFQKLAKEAYKRIREKGRIPMIVGGTGFYIQAFLYDIDFEDTLKDPSLREELEGLAAEKGNGFLHDMLSELDPASAEEIHANNVKRIIRAIEYFKLTGNRISEHNHEQRKKESPYDFVYFVLNDDRKRLYDKIDKRVDVMMEKGLLNEVRDLKLMGLTRDHVSMQGLGYKEILDHLDGRISLEEAVYRIKRDSRHFAKRQITWFKRERDVIWINKDEYGYSDDLILKDMKGILLNAGII